MEKVLSQENIPAFTGITCDSRIVKPGYAFIAISGFKTDGNQYIDDAIRKGASVIFTDKKVNEKYKQKNTVPIIKVKDARSHLGKLAADFYNHPSSQLELIGITGTNGKTTTTHLIYQLINYCSLIDENNINKEKIAKKAGLIGTVHVDNGKKIIPGDLTTPDPVKLQKYLDQMLKQGLHYVCMEVSSHGIKLKRIAGTNFNVKVGTNLSADHFDLHPDFDEYINVKKSFLEDKGDALVLLNIDNKYIRSFGQIAKNQFSYGINNKADVSAENIENWEKGHSFIYSLNSPLILKNKKIIKPYKLEIKTNLPGYHNIHNALIAITIALYYNIPDQVIQDFFKKFKGIWRRLQFIYDNNFTIIDDCAHNPGSYQAVFESISKMTFNKLIIVNSLRGNRGSRINQENAETITKSLKLINKFHLINSNCEEVVKPIDKVHRNEEKIFLNALKKKNIDFQHYQNLKPALKEALKLVDENDIILLIGPHAMDNSAEIILNMINKN